jgi:mono/diheme cytochrome c family protein
MLRRKRITALILGLTLTGALGAQENRPPNDRVEWGRYLAEQVGRCQECHTPRGTDGQFDRSRWMKGAVLNLTPIQPLENWHKESPDITPAGKLWKDWGGEEAIRKYLVTGLTPKGKNAGPPMPTYTLNPADAEAIVEYLKTLK